jgi:hypothetical protein
MHGATALGKPDWEHPKNKIPAAADSVAMIYCFHFLEHLTGYDAQLFLREVERVLIPERGVLTFSIPYYSSPLAQNLDHKSFWAEDTFEHLFHDDKWENFGKWKLRVHFLLICGIVQRNMCVIGQIVKSEKPVPVPKEDKDKWYWPTAAELGTSDLGVLT